MLKITAIPAFNDNYIWLLDNGSHAAVVDPGDAAPVIAYLQANQLTLSTLLITHHHADHTGGIAGLKKLNPELKIYYPAYSEKQWGNHPVKEGDTVTVLDVEFKVLEIPGHTLDHIAYFCKEAVISPGFRIKSGMTKSPLLFCGDTLFAGGCGRVFEGTFEQMYQSLMQLKALPGNTLVFCAHEYTLSNLRFAVQADPDNLAIQQRLAQVEQQRTAGDMTLPSTLALEKQTNVFLRAADPGSFAALRQAKDSF